MKRTLLKPSAMLPWQKAVKFLGISSLAATILLVFHTPPDVVLHQQLYAQYEEPPPPTPRQAPTLRIASPVLTPDDDHDSIADGGLEILPDSTGRHDWVASPMYPRTKLRIFMYSAYEDNRHGEPMVRVIGAYGCTTRTPLMCRLEFSDGSHIEVDAAQKTMNEHWKLRYGAAFFICVYPRGYPTPIRVRLKETFEQHWTPPIEVLVNRDSPTEGDFALCVKPLHYNYDKATWLTEFIEFHRILGVDHFFFYNHSTGPHVDAILKSYAKDGVVTIFPWSLNLRSQKDIRTEGLFAALNDCMYRTAYRFNFTLMLDVDEYMVPKHHHSYRALIENKTSEGIRSGKIKTQFNSFVFLNAFFYLYWENDTTLYGEKPEVMSSKNIPYLLTQYKTKRSAQMYKTGARSKFIVRPHAAVEAGNHVVWKYANASQLNSVTLSPDEALLHHYRICEFGGFACVKNHALIDRSAQRFGKELLSKVKDRCLQAFSQSGCPHAPPLGNPW